MPAPPLDWGRPSPATLGAVEPGPTLLWLAGFPGGGTDLAKTVLSAHPDIYLNGEMPRLVELAQRGYDAATVLESADDVDRLRASLRRLDLWRNVENLEADLVPLLRSRGRLSLEQALRVFFTSRDVRVWGNKTPQNTEAMPRLARLFPQSRFLVVVRDVRDVCLSWRRKWGRDVRGCAARWAQRMTAGLESARELPPGRALWIRFEDLLSDTESTCRRVCDFAGLPFAAAMLEHHRHLKADAVDGKINYGRAIAPENRGKWRGELRVDTVRRIEEIAFDALTAFGYPIEHAVRRRPLTSAERTAADLRDALAMLLVGNRAAEDNGLLRRWRNVRHELRKRLS